MTQHDDMRSACFHCGATWEQAHTGNLVMTHDDRCSVVVPLVEIDTPHGTYAIDPASVDELSRLFRRDQREALTVLGECLCDHGIYGPTGCICDRLSPRELVDSTELLTAWWQAGRALGFTAGGNRWAPV